MRSWYRLAVFVTAIGLLTGVSVLASRDNLPQQPRAAIRAQQTTFGLTTIVDPYRWMEKMVSQEFTDWAAGQDAHTRAVLDRIVVRRDLLKRLGELAAIGDEIRDVKIRAGKHFYLKRPAREDTFKLFVRDSVGGQERLLIDPRSPVPGASASIDYYEPSPTGRFVAFGLSSSGSEDSVLRVVAVVTGKVLKDSISRTRHGYPHWRPDGVSFFYRRNPVVMPGSPTAEMYQGSRDYLHVLGRDPDHDPAVFGFEVSPRAPVLATDAPYIDLWPGCPYVFAVAQHGMSNALTIYYAPLAQVHDARTPWKRLADIDDHVTEFAAHGNEVYILTRRNAPRGQVVRTRLDAPDLRDPEVVLRPSDRVVAQIVAASDALYVRFLDSTLPPVTRIAFDGSPAQGLKLPFAATIGELATDPAVPGFWCLLQSWTQPRQYHSYDPAGGRFADLGLQAPLPQSLPALDSREVRARSKDGTLVPLSIVYRRGLDLSTPHPTLLTGYGNYGVPMLPNFDPRRLAWLERGGIYAVAHVRGGGEYGEDWHRAGMKKNKQNTIDDFVACAQFLIERGYATPRTLAGEGMSAGGLTIGGAITQYPELFAAALVRVGITDAVRFETTPVGPANTREFGSTANPDDVAPLIAMSPYYHVVDGARYPAVLLTGAAHDARVPLWQPAKMAARLQAATASGRPILLRVERGAGHGFGFGTTNSQLNAELADCYAFLWWQLDHNQQSKP